MGHDRNAILKTKEMKRKRKRGNLLEFSSVCLKIHRSVGWLHILLERQIPDSQNQRNE